MSAASTIVTHDRAVRRPRSTVAVIGVVVGVVLLAACSDSDGDQPGQNPAPVETMRFPNGTILAGSPDEAGNTGS